MIALILFALLSLFFSFLCSIMEAVFLSITPSYTAALVNNGKRSGQILSGYKKKVDYPLAAILSLNTIAHTVGATGVGAQATSLYGSTAVGISSAILTLLMLIFSEVIPKTLGARYWRPLASPVAYSLVVLIWVMYPLVILSRSLTWFLSRGGTPNKLSLDEMKALADLGEQAGLFRDRESSILRNLFRFPVLQVKDIMTPRPVLFSLDAGLTVEQVLDAQPEIAFSRIPVHLKGVDSIIGYVFRRDLLNAHTSGNRNTTLLSLKRPIVTVPVTQPLSAFFDLLLDRREHIALVIDEYGGTAGIATFEDVVETLLGLEIVDEADTTEDMQAFARAQWKKRAAHLGLVKED